MILVCAGLVELHCTDCGELIIVGDGKGYVELADVNIAENDHQLGHVIQEHKEKEVLG